MTIFEAIVLGAVQGLTEFLPVSSSGHLVIFQHLFAVEEPPLTFDVLVHIGTLIPVFIVFWQDIWYLIKKPFSRLTGLILVGCIPAGLVGYFFNTWIEKAFTSLLVVGLGLLFTGAVLKFSEYSAKYSFGLKRFGDMKYSDAVFIGLLQALAIIPGISRSGSTIAGGLLAGLDREIAARFSFLMSIPVILGAGILELSDLAWVEMTWQEMQPYLLGFLSSIITGYIAIKIVFNLVKIGRLSVFTWYCWALAGIVLTIVFY
ncbi:MAG: undecaprenyl-diphosphate phosphatase [Syntrophomonadaceae bacterium]